MAVIEDLMTRVQVLPQSPEADALPYGEPVLSPSISEPVVSGTIINESDEVPESELPTEVVRANEEARQLMREHVTSFISRNGREASYEGWIAQLHPENVSIDQSLKMEGCEHQKIFLEALSQQVAGCTVSNSDTSDDESFARRLQAEEFAAEMPLSMGLRSASEMITLSKSVLGHSAALRERCLARSPSCCAMGFRAATAPPLFFAELGLRASEMAMRTTKNALATAGALAEGMVRAREMLINLSQGGQAAAK
eukprot:CAMPEP_0115850814 /NCGR_PEP_ID=MMETSP0287-20121206/12159_1 /TAXON_ID=412157 /ORGANISM="Chrysochromulina rotalis, Strain UIO044" /LENGTH=253 /DNA_ID=CAMNT_0003304825 /DNA_START=76 /DNA_END=838 /DNA_ORIENTATION=-